MLVEFSDSTATLIKIELPKIGQLFQTNEDENKLDLARIKQLKGCRTGLVRDCLKFIRELDFLTNISFFNSDERKKHLIESKQSLIEGLKKYLANCERYPWAKDFLNIIPDNTSGMVGFIVIASTLLAITSPLLALIPLCALTWVLIDLFFNNRTAAKNFREILFTAEHELRIIKEAYDIFKRSLQKHSETQESSLLATPGPSREYNTFVEINSPSCSFFNPAFNAEEVDNIDSDSSVHELKTIPNYKSHRN